MRPVFVLERFLPLSFWTSFTQKTNAYRDRQLKNPNMADADEADVLDALEGKPNSKAAWKNDYDLNCVPRSVGSSLNSFVLHVGMAVRPRHNTVA